MAKDRHAGKSWNDAGDVGGKGLACLQVGNLQTSKHGKSGNDAGDVGGKGPACLQVGNLQASKHGQSWNDAGDVGGNGPACLQVGNLQASKQAAGANIWTVACALKGQCERSERKVGGINHGRHQYKPSERAQSHTHTHTPQCLMALQT